MTHKLSNIESQKLKLNLEDGTVIEEGYKNRLEWLLTEMPAVLNLNDGQPNGQFIEYKAKIKIDPKKINIYGARHMKVFNLANGPIYDPSDKYTDGDLHTATVTGELYQFTLSLM